MIRRWASAGVVMVLLAAGCATDERKGQITAALGLFGKNITDVNELKEAVNRAAKKFDADTPLNLDEALDGCKRMKDFCKKELQQTAVNIQSSRTKLTDEERAELRKEFDGELNRKFLELNKATQDLDTAIKNLDKKIKDTNLTQSKRDAAMQTLDHFKKKLSETQAEFESLCRKS